MSKQAKKAAQHTLIDCDAACSTPPNSPRKVLSKKKTPAAPFKAPRKKSLREEFGFPKNLDKQESEHAALHAKLTSIKMRQTKLERGLKSLIQLHDEQDQLLKEATTSLQYLMFQDI